MSKKWTCNTKCYVSVGGNVRLRNPGDRAEGEMDKSAEKHFDRADKPIKKTVNSEPTKAELQNLCDDKGIKYKPNDNKATLKEYLDNHKDCGAEPDPDNV